MASEDQFHDLALSRSQTHDWFAAVSRQANSDDLIVGTKTGFVSLDRLLARIRADRTSFLKILERQDIPLHTNGSENDIRSMVTRRKISGGTQSDDGRAARDTLLRARLRGGGSILSAALQP